MRTGWIALLYKEVLRFYKVAFQTVAAPALSSLLYLIIFSQALSGRVQVYDGVGYIAFLVPGLAMMSLLQNAFANTSSSLIQSKISGNLIFLLLTPLGYRDWFIGYVGAAVVRGMVVAISILLVALLVTPYSIVQPLWMLCFAFLGAILMGSLGLIAGLWAEKFDQLAAFQNFIIMPATFLSGVFYSVSSLSPFWNGVSHFNPFFYLIDGFRYGFFGISDVSPWVSLPIVCGCTLLLAGIAMYLLRIGYKIRS